MFSTLVVCAVLYGALCVCVHHFVLHTGHPVTRTEVYTDEAGHARPLRFKALAGDLGTAVVAREIFGAEVYMRNGVHIPSSGSPLVVDVGCNIGLFSMFVMERNPQALVVAAEPIPALHALACANTARYAERVYVEAVAVAATATAAADFVVDPHITAGASMFEADITRAWRATSPCTQLAIVLSDNVRARSLPATPFLYLSTLLRKAGVRWFVLLALSPLLLLFVVFLLLGPSQKTTVRCPCVPLSQLLVRAAARVSDAAARDAVLQGPISLLKVDVEGAEWEVLRGMTEAEWRRVEQVVVEVHDVAGRVAQVAALLREHGFAQVHITREDWDSHEVLQIQSVFACREGKGQSEVDL